MEYTLITGASSGIGLDLAKIFAKNNNNLILIARSIDKLNALKQELEEQYKITVLTYKMDLSNLDFIEDFKKVIEDKDILNLVNNAGYGDARDFLDANIDKMNNIIDLNIKALENICYYVGLKMKERKKGRILNVGSAASFIPGPYMATYYATKSYVLSFSYALAVELKKYNITVSTLCPGPTKTDFAAKAEIKNADYFNKMGQTSYHVAKKGYKKMMKGRRIIKCSLVTYLGAFGSRFLPRRLLGKITYRANQFKN